VSTNADTCCRSCGSSGLVTFLSLGQTPLANALLDAPPPPGCEPRYPLDLAFCPGCSLVQITETVPGEELFGEYLYFSSYSDTMLRHARGLAEELTASRGLGADSLVVEAASNDGYLLRFYQEAGVPVLGIEPARNIARVARERGVPTREAFFGLDLARSLRAGGVAADVFHAHNVLAHVANLNGFVAGIREILRPGGVAVIEAPYVKEMLDRCEFDTIYHEHLGYFSLTALERCFRRHGLMVQDVRRVLIHGGSLRLHVAHADAEKPTPAVAELMGEEQAWGVDRLDAYLPFAGRVRALRESLRGLLGGLKRQGKRLAAYGASAKGSTLLNYCGIGRETLDFVVDRSPVKQGLYTPGTHLRVERPERLAEDVPDYVLLLTWNFADEILRQQAEYRRRGGKFIVPVPEPRVA
jgi:SAM-dependent methyltransferase